jgi:hypothetical protein
MYTEFGLKLPSRDLASLATQGVYAGAQVRGELPVRGGLPPNAYTGYGIDFRSKIGIRKLEKSVRTNRPAKLLLDSKVFLR